LTVPTSWNFAGEDGTSARAGDGDDAVLERMAEGIEDGTWELGKLVEQEHAAVLECGE
jgi:hypothetical protein